MGSTGSVFSSGVAATDAVIKLLAPGGRSDRCKWYVWRNIQVVHQSVWKIRYQIHLCWYHKHRKYWCSSNIHKTKLIWIETPTNPLMNITDIHAVSKITKKPVLYFVLIIHLLPIFTKPLNLGADIVMHSATKYLGGHSDVIQGALFMNDQDCDQLYFIQKSCGAGPGPFDCFQLLRGIKTLHVHMKQHCENGFVMVHFPSQTSECWRVFVVLWSSWELRDR